MMNACIAASVPRPVFRGLTGLGVSLSLLAMTEPVRAEQVAAIPGAGKVTMNETFALADKPEFTQDATRDYKLLKPWNYDKEWNQERRYPLVVSLHGGGGGGYYAPCIVGKENEMQQYPCFFMSPKNPSGWGESAAWVRDELEVLKARYRIDTNRVYLMGFSMGGSGSYPFAEGWYREHGGLFAGIVRLAGQSQPALPDALAAKTAVWYHIGLHDAPKRVEVAREAYEFYRSRPFHAQAQETVVQDRVGNHPRTTKTLTVGPYELFKLSEYEGLGHHPDLAFQDPTVLEWLFSRSLLQSSPSERH